jgi:hypothetical protein
MHSAGINAELLAKAVHVDTRLEAGWLGLRWKV